MNDRYKGLDQIRVAKPCQADWNEMAGDDRVRQCTLCKLNVYNLSEMSREDASAFIANREGRTCVRFYSRRDGTMITRDCPKGMAVVKRSVLRMLIIGFGGVGLAYGMVASGLRPREGASPENNPINLITKRLYRAFGERELAPPMSSHFGPTMGDVAAP